MVVDPKEKKMHQHWYCIKEKIKRLPKSFIIAKSSDLKQKVQNSVKRIPKIATYFYHALGGQKKILLKTKYLNEQEKNICTKSSDLEQKVQNTEKRILKIAIFLLYESISFSSNLLWSNPRSKKYIVIR